MLSDTASTRSRLTIPISPTFSTETESTGPRSALTSDEEPDLGAFATIFWALNNIQPAPPPRLPVSQFHSDTHSSRTPVYDQSSVSSFTRPGLSDAAESDTESPGVEAPPTSVWAQHQLHSYFNLDSITPSSDRVQELEEEEYNINIEHSNIHARYQQSPPLPSPLSEGSRTVEIYEASASDIDLHDTVSIPDYGPSLSPSHVPVIVGGTFHPRASSEPSPSLRSRASLDGFQVPTPRRSSFPVQDVSTAYYSQSSYSLSTSRPDPVPPLQTQSWNAVDDLSTLYSRSPQEDSEAAVQSLLNKARASRNSVINDNSTVAQTSASSNGSHSPHNSLPRAPIPHAYHRRNSQSSNRSNGSNHRFSPRVKPASPLRTSFTHEELVGISSQVDYHSPVPRSLVIDISDEDHSPHPNKAPASPHCSSIYGSPPAPTSANDNIISADVPPIEFYHSPRHSPRAPPPASPPKVAPVPAPYSSPDRRALVIDPDGPGRAYRAFSPRVTSPLRTYTTTEEFDPYASYSPIQRPLVMDDADCAIDDSPTPKQTMSTGANQTVGWGYELQLPGSVVLRHPAPSVANWTRRPPPLLQKDGLQTPATDVEDSKTGAAAGGRYDSGYTTGQLWRTNQSVDSYEELPSLGLLDEALTFIAAERAKREAVRSYYYGESASSSYKTGMASVTIC